jgi:hypothetical protein
MLRSLVLVLLIVNLGLFGWSQGWLRPWVDGRLPDDGVPSLASHQLKADQIEIVQASTVTAPALPPASAASAASAASTAQPAASVASIAASSAPIAMAGICVEAGPFNADDAMNVDEQLRAALPASGWVKQSIPISGLWMAYMGPYQDEAVFERKVNELKRVKGLAFDEVRGGPYAKGFSMGRFTSEADADARLSALRQRGIRTARVVTIRPAGQVHYLRVAQATQAMQVTLSSLRLPLGKSFMACRS